MFVWLFLKWLPSTADLLNIHWIYPTVLCWTTFSLYVCRDFYFYFLFTLHYLYERLLAMLQIRTTLEILFWIMTGTGFNYLFWSYKWSVIIQTNIKALLSNPVINLKKKRRKRRESQLLHTLAKNCITPVLQWFHTVILVRSQNDINLHMRDI